MTEAGQGHIERPADVDNLVWQTRAAPPDDYAGRLCDALETLFIAGISDLPGIVSGLNEVGLRTPAGEPWTEQRFCAEMRRLGA